MPKIKLEKEVKGIECTVVTSIGIDKFLNECFKEVDSKHFRKIDDIFDCENEGISLFVGIDSIKLVKKDVIMIISIDIDHFFNNERGYINKIRKIGDSYKISITTPSSEILKEKWDKDPKGFVSAMGQDVVPGMTARYLDITEPITKFVNLNKADFEKLMYSTN